MTQPIKLYNNLTKNKDILDKKAGDKVGVYVCGVTPYDHSHIGHARCYVVFDTLVRFLRASKLDVTYVRNFTDVDDKIIARAAQTGVEPKQLAEDMIASYHADMKALNVLNREDENGEVVVPWIEEPKVTDQKVMAGIIEFIEDLMAKGIAYQLDDGVYLDITKLPENEDHYVYGKLSGKKIEELVAGARVEAKVTKHNSGDFALWKFAKTGEPSWQSPWGAGRPGWHIECSVMSEQILGDRFDIHGGGEDLQFPHHENELAQSVAAHGHIHADFWLHNGFIKVNGEKMSKSLGNFTTIQDALKKYSGEAIRLWILGTHYRKPLDFSTKALADAEGNLRYMYQALERAVEVFSMSNVTKDEIEGEPQSYLNALNLMKDDLNTVSFIAHLNETVKALNTQFDKGDHDGASITLRYIYRLGATIGILDYKPTDYLKGRSRQDGLDEQYIDSRLSDWNSARENKDFGTADMIRDGMAELGIIFEVTKDGPKWRRG